MPVRVILATEAIQPMRGRKSFVKGMPEYMEALASISHGLKPQEVVQITFPISKDKGMKSILQTFKRTLHDDFKRLMLNDYSVMAFAKDGQNVIQISHQPAISVQRSVEQTKRSAGRR